MLPKDFYPTPQNIIDKMLCDLDFTMIRSILEPSAGKGDIVEALKKKKKTIINTMASNTINLT